MRKSALCILGSVLFCLSSAFAQPRVGVKLGFNYSSPSPSEPLPGQSTIMGYSGAVSLNSFLYDYLYLETDLALNQKGFVFMDKRFETRISITYLEIPLLLKGVYSSGAQSDFEFYAGAGPSVGYALFGRESTNDFNSFNELVFTKDWNRVEIGGAASLGTNISLGAGFLIVEGRYFYGLTSVDNSVYKPKNTVIGASVGYSYYKGRKGIKHRRY